MASTTEASESPPTLDDIERALDKLLARAVVSDRVGRDLAHCAMSIECSMAGYPRVKPWVVRATVGRLVKWMFLRRGAMKHDTDQHLPGAPELPAQVPISQGAARLREAIASFRRFDGELAPHLVFGRCDKAEYERLHAMHIADHLEAMGPPPKRLPRATPSEHDA